MTSPTATNDLSEPSGSILRVLLRCVTTIAGLSLLAKGMGFLRDAAAAAKFGTGDAMDAYTLALGIPTLMAGLFCNAMPTALIPAYARAKVKGGKAYATGVVANGVTLQFLTITAVCAVLGLLSQPLIDLIAGEFGAEKRLMGQQLFLVLLVFSVILSTSHAVTAALQAEKKFTVAAVSPAIIPVVAIAALFALHELIGVFSLAIGLVAGAAFHLLLLLYATTKEYGITCLKPNFSEHSPKQFMGDSMLILLGGALFGGCVMIDLAVASRLPAGTVATFGFADKVLGIVLSLAGVALGQALMPYLSEMQAESDRVKLRDLVFKLSCIVTGLTIPVVIVFWLAANPITQILFQRGEFGADETVRVASALRWGSLQFPAAALGVIASSMVIAMGSVRYMCWVSLIALIANVILDLTLAPMFGLAGILVATAIVHTISTVLLFKKIIQS
ncbi:MAG: murein biosynthesis integral membrane protein MurJ [Akkermansiaceae bacterium]